MARKILAVDVDTTLVDTQLEWWRWLELETKKGLRFKQVQHLYDIREAYKTELHERGLEGLDFWRQRNLYDYLSPLPNSIQVLDELSNDFDVIFVSQLKGDHHKSKVAFLKRHFPFMKGFLGTHEKRFALCDVLIDDRNHNLNAMPSNVVTILFDTPYPQNEALMTPVEVVKDWLEVRELFNANRNFW